MLRGKKRISLLCGLMLAMLISGCGKKEITDMANNSVCGGVTVFNNESQENVAGLSYNGYMAPNTALEWLFSSDYEFEVKSAVPGEFKVAFDYLGTTYVVFGDKNDTSALVIYDGEAANSKYIQVAYEFVYDIYCDDESVNSSVPNIDYSEGELYYYEGTDVVRIN